MNRIELVIPMKEDETDEDEVSDEAELDEMTGTRIVDVL